MEPNALYVATYDSEAGPRWTLVRVITNTRGQVYGINGSGLTPAKWSEERAILSDSPRILYRLLPPGRISPGFIDIAFEKADIEVADSFSGSSRCFVVNMLKELLRLGWLVLRYPACLEDLEKQVLEAHATASRAGSTLYMSSTVVEGAW